MHRRDLILTAPALILTPSALLAQRVALPQGQLEFLYTFRPGERRMVVRVATTRTRNLLRATVEEGGRRRRLAIRADLDRLERVALAVRAGGGRIVAGRTRADLSLLGDDIGSWVRLGLPGGQTATGVQPQIGPAAVAAAGLLAAAGGFALGFTLVVAGGVVAIVGMSAGQGSSTATASANSGETCDCEVAPEGEG